MNRSFSYPEWRKIQANPKPCKECGHERPIFSKGRCQPCAKKAYAKKAQENRKLRAPIAKVSKHYRPVLSKYQREKEKYMAAHPVCEFQDCNCPSTDLHHKAGRGKRTAMPEYFMAVCPEHHDYIHYHPKHAEALGYWIPTSKRTRI